MSKLYKNIMTGILISQVSLPYKTVKGSFSQRQNRSIQLVDKLYRNLIPQFKNGKLPFEKIQETIDSTLKKKIKINVKKTYSNEFDGFSDIVYSPISGCITATTLELSPIKNKIEYKDLITIVHEFQHITDQLFHPKYLARNQVMSNSGMYTNKYNKLYENFIYAQENPTGKKDKQYILKKLEHKLNKFLRKMSVEDKINYLQDSIYTLKQEEQAYYTQAKYAKIMNKKHLPINPQDLIKPNNSFMFHEKIVLMKKMAFDIIKAERKHHALKLKQQN